MKKSVGVDVDGVLAKYDGWKGVDHFGDPIDGAVEFTKRLGEYFDVVIFTTRCNEEMNKPEKANLLRNRVVAWLNRHGFHYDEVYIGQGKPIVAALIDDRAVSCRPQDAFNSRRHFDYVFREVCKLAFERTAWQALTFDEFQSETDKLAIYREGIKKLAPLDSTLGKLLCLNYAITGLVNEAGEVSGKLKKLIRDDHGELTEERRAQMLDELGDVAWYLSQCCMELGSEFSTVAGKNLLKLHSRLERGKLKGDGDNR